MKTDVMVVHECPIAQSLSEILRGEWESSEEWWKPEVCHTPPNNPLSQHVWMQDYIHTETLGREGYKVQKRLSAKQNPLFL